MFGLPFLLSFFWMERFFLFMYTNSTGNRYILPLFGRFIKSPIVVSSIEAADCRQYRF